MKKIALLIGNDQYADPRLAQLAVPAADVHALRTVLQDPAICGFDQAEPLLNADKGAIETAIDDLFQDRGRDDLVLLYFSGHGLLDAAGELFLALTRSRRERLLSSALPAGFLLRAMNGSRSRRQVIVLDCCHSGAFARGAKDGAGDGIGRPAVTQETFDPRGYGRVALLSSTATQLSWEGDRLIGNTDRSLFTHFLVDGLTTGAAAPDRETIAVGDLYQYAHRRVLEHHPGQTPQWWPADAQTGELILARNPAWRPAPEAVLPAELLAALDHPAHYVREGAVRELARLLSDPRQAVAARALLERRLTLERDRFVHQEIQAALGAAPAPTGPVRQAPVPVPVVPVKTAVKAGGPEPSSFHDRLQDGSDGPEMVWLPPGRFRMGSPEKDDMADDDERPQHEVRIPAAFAIGQFPVTFDDYDRFCAATGRDRPEDRGWGRGARPVILVSWEDAVAYCVWLTAQTGRTYRLPSEAEWEYACRAGTATRWSFGDDAKALGDHAWFNENSDRKTHPVGEKQPNPWELHDMHGNVWEWVQDHWYGSYQVWEWVQHHWDGSYQGAPEDGSAWEGAAGAGRVVRGGSWGGHARYCRCAYRLQREPGYRLDYLGFRCARVQEPAG